MWNAEFNEAQAGIKITGRNSNYLRYADYTNFKAESEEELKRLLMKEKEESKKNKQKQTNKTNKQTKKNWLKTQHSKN